MAIFEEKAKSLVGAVTIPAPMQAAGMMSLNK